MGGENIYFPLFEKKKKDGWTECVQRKPLYLLEETKNKPPTESKYVGVNATALASVDQEKKKGLMESYRYNFKKQGF